MPLLTNSCGEPFFLSQAVLPLLSRASANGTARALAVSDGSARSGFIEWVAYSMEYASVLLDCLRRSVWVGAVSCAPRKHFAQQIANSATLTVVGRAETDNPPIF